MTQQVRSHYENLKVARNAPQEVIRAAYKALAQKYHPDRNPSDSDASRIMSVVNEAYRVLSDPDLRRQHDDWIKENEVAQRYRQDASTSTFNRQHEESTSSQEHPRCDEAASNTDVIDLDRAYDRFGRLLPIIGAALAVFLLVIVLAR